MPKHLFLDEEQLDYLVIFLESGIEDSHALTCEHEAGTEEYEHGKDGLRVARNMLKKIDQDNPLLGEKIRCGVPFDFESFFKRSESEDESDEDEDDIEDEDDESPVIEVDAVPEPEVVAENERATSPR